MTGNREPLLTPISDSSATLYQSNSGESLGRFVGDLIIMKGKLPQAIQDKLNFKDYAQLKDDLAELLGIIARANCLKKFAKAGLLDLCITGTISLVFYCSIYLPCQKEDTSNDWANFWSDMMKGICDEALKIAIGGSAALGTSVAALYWCYCNVGNKSEQQLYKLQERITQFEENRFNKSSDVIHQQINRLLDPPQSNHDYKIKIKA